MNECTMEIFLNSWMASLTPEHGKTPFWGASNVGWWMVVITRPVAGTQAANEAPNAAKTTFGEGKDPRHSHLGAPGQNFRFRLRRPGAPTGGARELPHIFWHSREHPHPGISLPGGGPLGPSFNPGPLALWVRPKLLVAVQCTGFGCFFDGAPIGYLSDANICPLGGSSIFDAETLASLVRMFQVLSLKNFPTPWKPEPEALFGIFTV
ncbi:hypothetical protein C8J57DRAFT_1254365 [Mycena rebaudengoi]|nr:hypothetical protein C8J57DRAFT_1254365 [Mycena rebaudengoi]